MSGEKDDTIPTDVAFDLIVKELGDKREELLLTMLEADPTPMTTAQLRESTTVPSGSAIHHLERLKGWGLVGEQDEREFNSRSGQLTRVWTLTERGESFCSEHLDDAEELLLLKSRVEALEEKFEAMQFVLAKNGLELGTISEEMAEEWLNEGD